MSFDGRQSGTSSKSNGSPAAHAAMLDDLFARRIDWNDLIKTLRQTQSIGILEAEALALSHAGWRRWCLQRINDDPRCRKLASHHIRIHGPASLLKHIGDRIELRIAQTSTPSTAGSVDKSS